MLGLFYARGAPQMEQGKNVKIRGGRRPRLPKMCFPFYGSGGWTEWGVFLGGFSRGASLGEWFRRGGTF